MKNLVILIGNAGNVADVKTFGDGSKLARVSIATNEHYINKQGEKVEQTEWHSVIFKGKLAELAEKYVEKGKTYFIEGKLTTRTYDKDGVAVYVTEIVAREIKFL